MFDDLTADDYAELLARLLPRGKAWAVVAAANGLTLTVDGMSPELALAHNRLLDLLDESDMRTAVELLPGWERVLNLPDPCDPSPPVTTADRQATAHARFIARGGTQLQTLCDIAEAAGYIDVEFQQTDLFTPDVSTADSQVYDEEWSTFWYVWALVTPPQGWNSLLCLLDRIAPSYSVVQAIDGLKANEVSLPT